MQTSHAVWPMLAEEAKLIVIRLTTDLANNSLRLRTEDESKTISLSLSGNEKFRKLFLSHFHSIDGFGKRRRKVCARSIDPSRNFQTKTVNQSISPSIKRQNAIKGRKELKITAARVIFCPVGFQPPFSLSAISIALSSLTTTFLAHSTSSPPFIV
jgi:hypothetical protein